MTGKIGFVKRLLSNRWFQLALLLLVLYAASKQSTSEERWRQQIRNFTFDTYNIAKPRQASDQVVIVDLDETSQQAIGQWPWPRTILADLVLKLANAGANVIAFDMVFPEVDRHSPHKIAEILAQKEGFEDVVSRLKDLPGNDQVLGSAIKLAGNVVTGFSFTDAITDQSPRQKGIYKKEKDLEKYIQNLKGASANQKAISKYAAGNGSFFTSTDADGVIRRVPMLVGHNKPDTDITVVYPSLSLEVIRVLDQKRGGKIIVDEQYKRFNAKHYAVEGVQIGKENGRFIPTNSEGEFLVYFAKSNPDWYIPAYKVLKDSISPERFEDKIVLIGTSAVGLKDIRSTPLDAFKPGVEVHLNIIDQILQGQFLRRSYEAEGREVWAILILGLFIIVLAPFVSAIVQAAFLFIAVGAAIYGGWYAFAEYGLLIDVTYPVLAVLLIFMLSIILTFIRTEAEKKQVREAFGHYISPDFMKELTNDPDKLKLGGESRDLTVMFTDIRSFTTFSEELTPEELIQLMNDFLTPMSDLVMQNRGTIDKYMGDAMMAFWNAPLEDPDHARNACITALKMDKALEPINEELKKKALEAGKKPVLLNAGIGINTGPCAVGNMGSRQRFAYSALGDAVNLASRLEGQTVTYGVNILIGEDTAMEVPDFAVLEMDLLQVRGKTKPARVFALLGDAELARTVEFQDLKARHESMLGNYRALEFEKVIATCQVQKEVLGGKLRTFYSLYLKRAEKLRDHPPPKGWNGVYVAPGK